MRGYTQLTQEEPYQTYILKKAEYSQAEIAELLERDTSTISRKLQRNRGLKGYRTQQAHNPAMRPGTVLYRQRGLEVCKHTDPRGMESGANCGPGRGGTRGID